MRRLIGTALIIGFAITWRPEAAAGQYSWSSFSFSAGIGFGVGLSYTTVDPWYQPAYDDLCWTYSYYDSYAYPCRRSYYDVGYSYDYGYYDHYHSRRFVSLSYGYVPSHFYYPSYWGYGWGYPYWGGSGRLSFGNLYAYNWFGYGNHRGGVYPGYRYGDYAYYNNRGPNTWVTPRSAVAGRRGAGGRAINGTGYKEFPRPNSAGRVATSRAGSASAGANAATRGGVSATPPRSAQRTATARRAAAPSTRSSASRAVGGRATGARPTASRARPSDAIRGRTDGRSSVSRSRPPVARAAPSRGATPSARTAPSTRRSSDSRPSSSSRSNLVDPNSATPAAPSRPSARPGARSASPSTRSATPDRSRTAPSRARPAPSSSARRAPSRPSPGLGAARSARPPTRSARPSASPREGLNNPHLGRNAIGCGSKIRFEDLSER